MLEIVLLNSCLLLVFAVIGHALDRMILKKESHIIFENIHKESNILKVVSLCALFFSILSLLLSVSNFLVETLPLSFVAFAINKSWLLFCCFTALATGLYITHAYKTKHPKRHYITATLLLFSLTMFFVQIRLYSNIAYQLSDNRDSQGVVLQTSGSSCSAAALSNALMYFKIDASEKEIAKKIGTSSMGTYQVQIIYGLSLYDIKSNRIKRRTVQLKDIKAPAILSIDHPAVGKERHSVTYFGINDKGQYEIWDPIQGKEFWSEDTADKRWHGKGLELSK